MGAVHGLESDASRLVEGLERRMGLPNRRGGAANGYGSRVAECTVLLSNLMWTSPDSEEIIFVIRLLAQQQPCLRFSGGLPRTGMQ